MSTITIDQNVRSLLDGLKVKNGESYNSVIKRIAVEAYNRETIIVSIKVQEDLDKFKSYPEESYNSIIERLIYMYTKHNPISDKEIKKIKTAEAEPLEK